VSIDLEKEDNNIPEDSNSRKSSSGQGITLKINLLGYQVREEIEKSSKGIGISKPILAAISLIGIAILVNAISYLVLTSLRDEQLVRKEQLERRKAELETKEKELVKVTEERDILKQKRDILLWASGSNFKMSGLLEEIRERTPSNLWVSKIDISDSLSLSITGQTFDHKTVALFLANLQDSPFFTNVVLDFTKKNAEVKIRDITKIEPNKILKEELKDKPNESYMPPINLEEERSLTTKTDFSIKATVVVNQNK
jgi:Tfp pilus assembly protein PilN